MELRSNLIAQKTAVRNCERMVLGLPYRPLNTIGMRMKMYTSAAGNTDERGENPILQDEANDLVMSRGESEDLFVDEDSINANNLLLPKLL
jgi:hypothetical protein